MILLFGVAIFSYVLGNFIKILKQFNEIHSELTDGENLHRFFGLLQRFNGNHPIEVSIQDKISAHFDFKWNNDKIQAIDEPDEIAMLD